MQLYEKLLEPHIILHTLDHSATHTDINYFTDIQYHCKFIYTVYLSKVIFMYDRKIIQLERNFAFIQWYGGISLCYSFI